MRPFIKPVPPKVKSKNKFSLRKSYYKAPTPALWRKIGDSLLGIATIVAIGGLFQFDNLKEIFTTMELRWMIGGSIALGVIGKFLTNFFKNRNSVE
jgi:hypothetical protein